MKEKCILAKNSDIDSFFNIDILNIFLKKYWSNIIRSKSGRVIRRGICLRGREPHFLKRKMSEKREMHTLCNFSF